MTATITAAVFDMSTFPSTHPLYDGTFKDVPGKFKIETKGKIFAEIVSLAEKLLFPAS